MTSVSLLSLCRNRFLSIRRALTEVVNLEPIFRMYFEVNGTRGIMS